MTSPVGRVQKAVDYHTRVFRRRTARMNTMNGDALIELTLRYGPYGRQRKTVAVQISEDLTDELMGGIELSNDPFSLFVASPGFLGGRGDALTIRRRTLKMRRGGL